MTHMFEAQIPPRYHRLSLPLHSQLFLESPAIFAFKTGVRGLRFTDQPITHVHESSKSGRLPRLPYVTLSNIAMESI